MPAAAAATTVQNDITLYFQEITCLMQFFYTDSF